MGIALQIIEIAQAAIPKDLNEVRVAKVNLSVGKLAAVVPDSLLFCFELVAEDTPFAGAELVIEEIPVVARCKDCQTRWTIEDSRFECPKCHSGQIEILSGRELDVMSIEVDDK